MVSGASPNSSSILLPLIKSSITSSLLVCSIQYSTSESFSIKELTPFHVEALMYFFFLTIAYEGAMENVDAFDQPGVEDYKKILHEDLRKYIVKNQKEEN